MASFFERDYQKVPIFSLSRSEKTSLFARTCQMKKIYHTMQSAFASPSQDYLTWKDLMCILGSFLSASLSAPDEPAFLSTEDILQQEKAKDLSFDFLTGFDFEPDTSRGFEHYISNLVQMHPTQIQTSGHRIELVQKNFRYFAFYWRLNRWLLRFFLCQTHKLHSPPHSGYPFISDLLQEYLSQVEFDKHERFMCLFSKDWEVSPGCIHLHQYFEKQFVPFLKNKELKDRKEGTFLLGRSLLVAWLDLISPFCFQRFMTTVPYSLDCLLSLPSASLNSLRCFLYQENSVELMQLLTAYVFEQYVLFLKGLFQEEKESKFEEVFVLLEALVHCIVHPAFCDPLSPVPSLFQAFVKDRPFEEASIQEDFCQTLCQFLFSRFK